MKPICRQCGQPFSPIKSYYVICFACHLKAVRARVLLRAEMLEKRARVVTQSGEKIA